MSEKLLNRYNTSLIFVILITLMAMLSLLPSDMYLPALPAIQQNLSTTISSIQMTLSSFFLGAAVSQIIIGPLADRFGLRFIGILSIILFTIASFFCAISSTIEQLIILRFLQASGAGFAAVVARAAITKNYDANKAAHVFLIMSPVLAVSPAVAPIIGGLLARFFGWRSIFLFITLLAILILVLSLKYLFVRQDNLHHDSSIHPISILKNYWVILKNRRFSSYLATRCGVDAAYFGYITASPFIFHQMGFSTLQIGNFYIALIITFVATAYLTKSIMDTFSKDHLMIFGLGISITGGILLLLIGLTHYHYASEIIIPASIMTAGYGFTGSLSWSEAMAQIPVNQAGSASSLIGFFPLVAAALSAALVNILTHGSVAILAFFMLLLLSAVLTQLIIITRVAPLTKK